MIGFQSIPTKNIYNYIYFLEKKTTIWKLWLDVSCCSLRHLLIDVQHDLHDLGCF